MILINLKIYKEGWGEKGIEIGKIVKKLTDRSGVRIVVAAPALEAVKIKEETGAEVWLQHVDYFEEGKFSGRVSMKEAINAGIRGSLLNHSEHKLKKGEIQKTLKFKPSNFEIAVCVHSLGQIDWLQKSKPEWILYEPPELIASIDKSVATEKPETIKNAVEKCGQIKLMVGAGIKDKNDVCVSVKLGAKGVGLASAFVLGEDKEELLSQLVEGFGV